MFKSIDMAINDDINSQIYSINLESYAMGEQSNVNNNYDYHSTFSNLLLKINENNINDNEKDDTQSKTLLKQKTKRKEIDYSIEKHEENNNFEYNNENANNSIEFRLFNSNLNFNYEDSSISKIYNCSNYINNTEGKMEVTTIEIKEDEGMNNINEEKKGEKSICGRKKDEDKKNGHKGAHTKDSPDNIIRKIKSFFGKSLYHFIKRSFIKEENLLKLVIDVNINLKKDYNEQLFKTKLRNLFTDSDISAKYKLKNEKSNEELINKVYDEKKEEAVMKILDLTYIEAFNIFRRKLTPNQEISLDLKRKIEGTNFLDMTQFNDVEMFLNKIIKEEKNKGEKDEDIIAYINVIKNLILNFENWFEQKVGRNR
jgi:hypothetical protein